MVRVVYEFPAIDGTVRVETDEPQPKGPQVVSRGDQVVAKASETFEAALSGIRPIAEGIVAQTAGLASAPRTVEASFGIKLSGEMGVLLASTTAEANIQIKLTWEREADS